MPDAVVATDAGRVKGAEADGVFTFLAVPYAAPPVGELRFQKPQRHTPWDDVRDATKPGPTAPQVMRPFPALDIVPLLGEGWIKGEEFLNINVWTPDPSAKGLPVMVFIHGGAWVAGCNSATVQDGSTFARKGVVCMAINYRMGVEGFLAIPDGPTNLGLRDQIAALEWVQRNAAAFGGDPGCVTVFGESAGAMSIADLIASPLAKGLFRRAIIQSGHGSMVRSIPVAQRVSRKLAKMLGVAPTLEGFKSRTVEDCLAAMETMQRPTTQVDLRDENRRDPVFGISKFAPVYGDDVLPDPPLQALAKGVGAEVEVLIGANAEEMNLYFVPANFDKTLTRLMAWFVLSRTQPKALRTLNAYGMNDRKIGAGPAFIRAATDLVFRLPARAFAAAHKGQTHLYEFGWRSGAFDGRLGACHGLELPFVFNVLKGCCGPKGLLGMEAPQALADQVQGLWAGFARDGALPWPTYDPATRQVFALERNEAFTDPDMPAARYWP